MALQTGEVGRITLARNAAVDEEVVSGPVAPLVPPSLLAPPAGTLAAAFEPVSAGAPAAATCLLAAVGAAGDILRAALCLDGWTRIALPAPWDSVECRASAAARAPTAGQACTSLTTGPGYEVHGMAATASAEQLGVVWACAPAAFDTAHADWATAIATACGAAHVVFADVQSSPSALLAESGDSEASLCLAYQVAVGDKAAPGIRTLPPPLMLEAGAASVITARAIARASATVLRVYTPLADLMSRATGDTLVSAVHAAMGVCSGAAVSMRPEAEYAALFSQAAKRYRATTPALTAATMFL